MRDSIGDCWHQCPVLVVGDLMLDEFIWGEVTRISPEAPVPVVRIRHRTAVPGGAANAAVNVAALGGRAILLGVVGDDREADRLLAETAARQVEADTIIRLPHRPTTSKTRVVAHAQQVVRIDHEELTPLPTATERELLQRAVSQISQVRACILSDYAQGVLTPDLVRAIIAAARRQGVPVIVDPKGTVYDHYRGATVVKPNQAEAAAVLHRPLLTDRCVSQAGHELMEHLGQESVILITRGAAGMTLFRPFCVPEHFLAPVREVFDVTGAGDTVAAVLGLGLAVNFDWPAICRLAARAAAVVVGKSGTATCSLAELYDTTQNRCDGATDSSRMEIV